MSRWDDMMAESEPYPHFDQTMPRFKTRTWVKKGPRHTTIRRARLGRRNMMRVDSFTVFTGEAGFIREELKWMTE